MSTNSSINLLVIDLNDTFTTKLNTDTPNIEKIDQCDYTYLFSHLYSSIHSAHADILKNGESFQFQEEATFKLAISIICILFGLFFAIVGYRFLKFSTFIVGFSLGSGVIYLILSEQKQLSTIENVIISLSIGVLFAFVALLVQYIGLFLIGITSSISIVTCILILIDLFYTNESAWVCIGLLFICATILASFTLKFQKSLTIVNTSIIGSALLFVAIDFIVENNLLIDYIYELFKVNGHVFNIYEREKALLQSDGNIKILKNIRIKTTTIETLLSKTTEPMNFIENPLNNGTITSSNGALALFLRLYSSANAKLCWYTWCVFGSFFVLFVISFLIQSLCTGRHHDHRESWQKLIRGSRKKKTANLEKIRLKQNITDTENHHHNRHLKSNPHNHTRHLHQNNDVYISSSCSSSQIDLVATNQNDTLLLVNENGQSSRTLSYTESLTSDDNLNLSKSHKQKKNKTNDKNNDFEIVSFEVKKTNKGERISKNKNGVKSTENSQNKKSKKSQNSGNKTSETTTSTSSTNSSNSSSSMCQLIPMKLNMNSGSAGSSSTRNGSLDTASTTVGATSSSAKGLSPVTSNHHGTLHPPPVPTLPPPKLPVNLTISSNTDTLNSGISLTNSILVPTLPNIGIPKLKHHRHSGASHSIKSDSKSQSSENKFRHLYQIRRNQGDVLSQDFLKNVHAKQASNSQVNTLNNNHINIHNSSFVDSNSFELRSSSLSTGDKKNSQKKSQEKSKKK